MQQILHIPSLAALAEPYIDEAGKLTLQPAHLVGTEALVVAHDPAPELLAAAVVLGSIVNQDGEPAPLFDSLEAQAVYDRLWPRVPVTTEDGTFTPPLLFGCLGTPPAEPSLTLLKERRIAVIRAACQAAIFAGFTSDALGAPHLYPCKQDGEHRDQGNLSGLVLESTLPGTPEDWTCAFWCADAAEVWELRAHTAAQIQAVGRACSAHIGAAVARCDVLTREVLAATTAGEVDAIVW